jgi:hypothetical protein
MHQMVEFVPKAYDAAPWDDHINESDVDIGIVRGVFVADDCLRLVIERSYMLYTRTTHRVRITE